MHRIALAGHLCVDLTPTFAQPLLFDPGALHEVGPLRTGLGGCVANTGRALGALGMMSDIHATVGDDELGALARALISATPGLEGRPSIADGVGTSYSIVLEGDGRDRTFWHHVGANAVFDGTALDFGDADILHIGYPSLLPALLDDQADALVRLLSAARDHGITTSLDLAVVDPRTPAANIEWQAVLRRIAPLVDVLTPSIDDLTSALQLPAAIDSTGVERLADVLVDQGAGVVAISRGSSGMIVRTAGEDRLHRGGRAFEGKAATWADKRFTVPARLHGIPVTTNGAGDASSAGFLFALASDHASAEQAAALAGACAAAILTGDEPTPERVLELDPSLEPLMRRRASPAPTEPIVLAANQPADRFYEGGERIARFRGRVSAHDHTPEDWIGSVTTVRGQEPAGLTTLPDGRLLADAVHDDPIGWLGREHVQRWGDDPRLLVKLLDAGERLPVHAHPDAPFAATHLGTAHGKAEAWCILEPGSVRLGLREDLEPAELERIIAEQDSETLLGLLHELWVERGDRVFVPPGTLHSIGAGILLAEVQEPEDLSILIEWRDFPLDGTRDGHLGLGFATAMGAIDLRGIDAEALASLIRKDHDHDTIGLPEAAAPFFRADTMTIADAAQLPGGFAVVIVTDGEVQCRGDRWPRGTTVLVPAAAGPLVMLGTGEVIVFRPPLP
ncbi:PfkB family carbohydrate kinase [Rathayibacter sp. CAU 1779]